MPEKGARYQSHRAYPVANKTFARSCRAYGDRKYARFVKVNEDFECSLSLRAC